jgi:hypothetical protein
MILRDSVSVFFQFAASCWKFFKDVANQLNDAPTAFDDGRFWDWEKCLGVRAEKVFHTNKS